MIFGKFEWIHWDKITNSPSEKWSSYDGIGKLFEGKKNGASSKSLEDTIIFINLLGLGKFCLK